MEVVSDAPTAPFDVTFHSKAERVSTVAWFCSITLTSSRSATQESKAEVPRQLGHGVYRFRYSLRCLAGTVMSATALAGGPRAKTRLGKGAKRHETQKWVKDGSLLIH